MKKFFVGYGINALDEESILKSAHLFWFKDEDWLGDTKIFDYFTLKIEKEIQK